MYKGISWVLWWIGDILQKSSTELVPLKHRQEYTQLNMERKGTNYVVMQGNTTIFEGNFEVCFSFMSGVQWYHITKG